VFAYIPSLNIQIKSELDNGQGLKKIGKRKMPSQRQSGMVLILVLLVVALVVGLSVKYASQFQLGMARAESRWASTQAKSLLVAAEEVAILLFPLADIDASMDYPDEPWNNPVPLTDEGVEGVAMLFDAQAQLNLNDLGKKIDPASLPGSPERYSESQRQFIRLLQTFQQEVPVSQGEAEAMLEAVVDWLDNDDDETGGGGAESNYYQGMPDPYLPANTLLFRSVDELRLVRGFNERSALVELLKPYITVLPKNDVGLSVNDIPPQNPFGLPGVNRLRLCINSKSQLLPLSDQQAQTFLLSRPETGYAEPNDFNDSWRKAMGAEDLDLSAYKMKTDFFWLESTVQMGEQRRQMRSLMQRDNNSLIVVQRRMMYELPQVNRGKKDDENSSELKL
jgi:general secretion pathway protein K